MSRRRKLLVADLLCGAGGSSTGCAQALAGLGREMELVCVNHWGVAIETHRRNHPEARHYVQDIAAVRPHLVVPEGYLDLLMASPTCTHHSVARGGKPTSDQQRSDPWHIVTWLTELKVARIIIENVWEFTGWGPVDPASGKPYPARKGEYFAAWIETLRRLGFEPQWRKLNAADYGEATTRQRFILMARSDGRRVVYPAATHMKRPAADGLALFPGLAPWRPAREIIDWRLKGRSIFGRAKPLAPKTIARIYAGALKLDWPEPYLVILRNHMAARGLGMPLPALSAGGTHVGLAEPVVVRTNMHGRKSPGARAAQDPLMTITTDGGIGVAEAFVCGNRTNNTPKHTAEPVGGITTTTGGGFFLAEPVVAGKVDHQGHEGLGDLGDLGGEKSPGPGVRREERAIVLSQHSSGAARSAGEPLPTLTTGGAGAETHPGCARPMLVEPFIVNGRRGNEAKAVATEPVPTLDTKGGVWLAEPFIATVAHGNSPGDATADARRVHGLDDPLGAMHAGGGAFAVVEPFVLSQGAGGVARPVGEPAPAIPTHGAHALISPYYGSGSGESCVSAEEPLPTATAKARFGMVVPVTHVDGANRARDADEPLPTLTTAKRGELAFITAQFGEREGQAPRTHNLDEPAQVAVTLGHGGLVEPGPQYDILFRMLEPHELAAAMGFDGYDFAGTKTDQIKQIGNAVSVKLMKACVGAIMADAAPRRRAEAPRAKAVAA